MSPRSRHFGAISLATAVTVALASSVSTTAAQAPDGKRPMTFLDQQNMRQVGSPTPSPDRKWLLYTISVPDWKEAKRQTDIYVVSMDQGVSSTRTVRSSFSRRIVTHRRAVRVPRRAVESHREARSAVPSAARAFSSI